MSGAPSLSKEEARLAGRAFRSLGTGSTPATLADGPKGGAVGGGAAAANQPEVKLNTV